MKCPKCGKELLIRDEKVAVDENGTAVYNQFAVCMDCKKKWNLDKQRAKKTASQAKPAEVPKAPAAQKSPAVQKSPVKPAEAEIAENGTAKPVKKSAPAEMEARSGKKKTPVPAETEARPVKKKAPAPAEAEARPAKKKAAVPAETEAGPARKKTPAEMDARPVKKKTPVPADPEAKPAKKKAPAETDARPVKKKPQTYSNIPPKEVREKREEDMRRGYDEMLTSGEEDDEPKRSKIPVIIMTVLIVLALAAAGTIFYCKATGKAIPFISLSQTENAVSGEMYAQEVSSYELPAEAAETDLTETLA